MNQKKLLRNEQGVKLLGVYSFGGCDIFNISTNSLFSTILQKNGLSWSSDRKTTSSEKKTRRKKKMIKKPKVIIKSFKW
jgi:hypothetical protein